MPNNSLNIKVGITKTMPNFTINCDKVLVMISCFFQLNISENSTEYNDVAHLRNVVPKSCKIIGQNITGTMIVILYGVYRCLNFQAIHLITACV